MSPLVNIDNTGLRDGQDPQSGAAVFAKLKAILQVLNGGIDATNIAPNAGIPGTRLSNVSGSQVPTDRLADKAVDSRVLKSDSATGAPGAAIQSGAYVKDGALGGKKLTALTVGADRLKLASVAWKIGAFSGSLASYDTGISSADVVPVGFVVRHPGAPSYASAFYSAGVSVFLNTSDNHYYIQFVYLGGAGASGDLTGQDLTVVFYYLTLASS